MSLTLKRKKYLLQKLFKMLMNTGTGIVILECFSPLQFSISLSATEKVDMTMRKGVPLVLISLVLFWESQQSALPFVLLMLCQRKKSELFLLLWSLGYC